jgi:hypothetical protein
MTQSPGERGEAEERFDGLLNELHLMNRFEYDILFAGFLSKTFFAGIRGRKDCSIMIAFDLICANGHKFECWFKSGDSFDEQKSIGVINCPVCHDNHVEKLLSPVAIRKHAAEKQEKVDPQHLLKQVYEYIDKNFEDVGLNFTREAIKMHYGDAEKRNIKGQTLPNEEKILKDEGIPFLKIPLIKRLDN